MIYFCDEDNGSIERIQARLRFLEDQHQIRTKWYEDEVRRIRQGYEEKFAEIEEATTKAARRIELEFEAKREAIKSQYRREECGKMQPDERIPFTNKSHVRPVCESALQFKQPSSQQQPTPSQTKYLESKPTLDAVTVTQDADLFPDRSSIPTSYSRPTRYPMRKEVIEVDDESLVSSRKRHQPQYSHMEVASCSSDYDSLRESLAREDTASNLGLQTNVPPKSLHQRPASLLIGTESHPLPGYPTDTAEPLSSWNSDESKDDVQYVLQREIVHQHHNTRGALCDRCDQALSDMLHDRKIQRSLFDGGGRLSLTTIFAVFDPGGTASALKAIWFARYKVSTKTTDHLPCSILYTLSILFEMHQHCCAP